MDPEELKQALADVVAPLGPDARASVVISSNGPGVYVSAEAHWKIGADGFSSNKAQTFEDALDLVRAWVGEAPIRNRVMTAEDLFGAAA
jgi:hypothetical protein